MVKSVLIAFTVILAVFGICEFIYIIRMFFLCPGIRTTNYSLVVLNKGFAVAQLNFIYQKMHWYGDDFSSGIVALTDMLDQNEINLCNQYIKDKKILLCNLEDFSKSEYIKGGLLNG